MSDDWHGAGGNEPAMSPGKAVALIGWVLALVFVAALAIVILRMWMVEVK